MKRILPVAIFISLIVMLSQFARTSSGPYPPAAAAETQQASQFQLKQSYQLGGENHDLLATIYSCGSGSRKKEVLSIWSRDVHAYELQYIRTAAAGESFLKPEIFSIERIGFVKISTRNTGNGHSAMITMLSITPELTLHEIPSNQAIKLIKIRHNKA